VALVKYPFLKRFDHFDGTSRENHQCKRFHSTVDAVAGDKVSRSECGTFWKNKSNTLYYSLWCTLLFKFFG